MIEKRVFEMILKATQVLVMTNFKRSQGWLRWDSESDP